jgi:hypothetical protein
MDFEKKRKLFTDIASLSQVYLKEAISEYLHSKYEQVYETDTYICAVGEIDIALMAHLDTVFQAPKEIFFDLEKMVFWSPEGLGADDRAGVYAIISLIMETNLRPHIIFTTDEEIGGVGAKALAKIENPFPSLKYIIELDRQGKNDCVFYGCGNKEFQDYVVKFGFHKELGTFSDITFVCPAWNVAGVNLSIGYENEHSRSEILRFKNLQLTMLKVKKMLEDHVNISAFDFQSEIISCFACNKNLPVGNGYTFNDGNDSFFICNNCWEAAFNGV